MAVGLPGSMEGELKKSNGVPILYRSKLWLIVNIAGLLHKLGFSWKSLGYSIFGKEVVVAQSRNLLRRAKIHSEYSARKQKVVFLTMLGGHIYNTAIDICLAEHLRHRGHEVTFVIDDQTLPITELHTLGNEKMWSIISARHYEFAKMFLKAWRFKIIGVSSFLKESSTSSFDFTETREATLLKHFRVGTLDTNLEGFAEKSKKVEESIRITSKVGAGVVKMKPDCVIMSHGIYSTWGPPFQILRDSGIPVLTYGRGKKAGTSKFNWNYTSDWWDISEEWLKRKDIPLNEADRNNILHYLDSRKTHKNDVFVFNQGLIESRDETFKRLSLNPSKCTYSLFTNLLWDASSAQKEIVFNDPVEWVLETIMWFTKNPDKQLIVKIHPAEKLLGTNMPFMKLIDAKFKQLPENIRVIEPHEKINSWSIYHITDLGIVHTTIVGLELPVKGIPCAVVSKTHFRDKGFTIDVSDKNEYFNLLNDFDRSRFKIKQMQELALRYAYILFEKYQMPLNLFNEKASTDVRSFKFDSVQELLKNTTLKIVADAIEKKSQSIMLK